MTKGILPARLRIHMRSSTARVIAIRRYISIRSSRVRPRSAPSAVEAPSSAALVGVRVAIVLLGPVRVRDSLEVDRLPVDRERSLADRLGEGRMRVDRRSELPGGSL